jgi:tRNA modification GTPase
MYTLDDTIVAIATPIGQGGIGIVRLSGPESLAVARGIFRPASHSLAHRHAALEPNRLYYGHIVEPTSGRPVDEVLFASMPAPHSYTRQDVVEIHAHGGPAPLREILRLCLHAGARPAHEGEFTLRAFLNGRLDLAQAEAVLDVIRAKTEASLRVSVNQLGGGLSRQVRALRRRLVDLLAYLEARVDFPSDDVPARDITPDLQALSDDLTVLLREAQRGLVYRQGVRTAIVGRPNVGKSSLLNALLRADRAIVTPIPGTTRDTLEETLDLQGIPFVLVDTAGINASEDLVEQLGVERSRRSLRQADLVLLVVDGSQPPSAEDAQVAALAEGVAAVVVVNKRDLPAEDDYREMLPSKPHVAISATTGEGLAELEERLATMVLGGAVVASDAPLLSSPRHRELVDRALGCVTEALRALAEGWPEDMLAIDLRDAVLALGEITGESASEDLLASIFGQFCIGK